MINKKKEKDVKEIFEIITLIKNLPDVPAPPNFEKNLYKKLGISYIPIYMKVLSLTGLSFFAAVIYFSINWLYKIALAKIHLARLPEQLSLVYIKILQFISLIKVGNCLKNVYFVLINPWLLVALALISSVLILILIGLYKEVKESKVVLIRF